MSAFVEYLKFERFLAAPLLTILFWLGIVSNTVICLASMVLAVYVTTWGSWGILIGLLWLAGSLVMMVAVPLILRLACELCIVIFKINGNLYAMRMKQPQA